MPLGGGGAGGSGVASGSSAGSFCSAASAGGGSSSTLGVGLTAAGRPQRLSRNELKQLDEKQLIFELVSRGEERRTQFGFNGED